VGERAFCASRDPSLQTASPHRDPELADYPQAAQTRKAS
jgi:hypothetical protein